MPYKNKEDYTKYRHSPKGRAIVKWSDLCHRVENKDGKNPTYTNVKLLITKEEFFVWIIPELEKWQRLGKPLVGRGAPVLDRIFEGDYELGNLQLITQKDNNGKKPNSFNNHAPLNFAWCSKCQDYLSTSNFHKHSKRSNKLQDRCKECRKKKTSQKPL